MKINKFCRTATSSEPRSPVIEDNLEEPSCDPDCSYEVEINSEKPSGLYIKASSSSCQRV